MATPTAAYSVRLRLKVPNAPGTLGRVATAIGEAGGNITAIDIVEGSGASTIEDISVDARDGTHA
ncbi:MAG: ACT domain-containing protein, partial [Actinomycetota bacterium]